MSDQFQKIGSKVVTLFSLADIPGGTAVESAVIFGHIAVDTDHNQLMSGDIGSDTGNGVLALVIVLQGIAIAVAMKIVDNRVGFFIRVIVPGQENTIEAWTAQNFRFVSAVIERPLIGPHRQNTADDANHHRHQGGQFSKDSHDYSRRKPDSGRRQPRVRTSR